MARKLTYRLKQ